MVVPADILTAARAGNFDVVHAYFASGPRDVEDDCEGGPGMTMPVPLLHSALAPNGPLPVDGYGKCRIVEMLLAKAIVAGVRREGSWKAYCRVEHKRLLRLRSYLVRGYAETTDARVDRILRLPNGACWTVLAYWREAA